MTDKELQNKREKGLCFRCDDKWSLGHRCRRRELSVLLVHGEDEINGTCDEDSGEIQHSEICLNSVLGITNPKTLIMKGEVQGSEVIVMIDPGATHSFISPYVVHRLGLSLNNTKEFGVSLGNGESVKVQGECQGVRLSVRGLEITEDFLPHSGKFGYDSGVQWLEKLGTVSTN